MTVNLSLIGLFWYLTFIQGDHLAGNWEMSGNFQKFKQCQGKSCHGKLFIVIGFASPVLRIFLHMKLS